MLHTVVVESTVEVTFCDLERHSRNIWIFILSRYNKNSLLHGLNNIEGDLIPLNSRRCVIAMYITAR
jgi:hypothetical protein